VAISNGSGLGSDLREGTDWQGRHVLRLGAKIKGEDVPTVPERYRGLDGPTGKVVSARLVPATGELWLRLVRMSYRPPFERTIRTIPLSGRQSPAPAPEAVELRGGMRVYCHEGFVGRLEGVTFDTHSGLCIELVIRIRSDILSDVETTTSPLAKLLDVAGARLLISPAWASSVKREANTMRLRGDTLTLHLDASPEQIASGTRLRSDREVAGDIWGILDANPAILPFTAHLHVEVRDGSVRLSGTLPTPRHRASAEQDIWHVPGVFALHDETTLGS
jgi:hypothetical protein